MSGASLRPYAREVLTALHAAGATLLLWSAGGGEHARAVAARHDRGLAALLACVGAR
jgi:phosphoserine phosphatase